ncbi:hypothetical protein [Paraburkholderia sp. CI3]|uniref:hypothetical protein n=1 Tax=Paraburkholderia sp. CI3 TaxID=2991060 RepID=UPI003D23CC0F
MADTKSNIELRPIYAAQNILQHILKIRSKALKRVCRCRKKHTATRTADERHLYFAACRATTREYMDTRLSPVVSFGGRDLMSISDVAQLLNVSPGYVRKQLMRRHALRPVVVRRGRKLVLRAKAEAYRLKRRRAAGRALHEIALLSQEVGLYEKTKLVER